jgi:hypothetical protein
VALNVQDYEGVDIPRLYTNMLGYCWTMFFNSQWWRGRNAARKRL